MKAATQTRTRTALRGLLATLLTVGLFSTAGFARDGGGSDDQSMFGGGSSGGIGTVPVVAGGNTSGPVPNGQGELGGASEFKPTLRIVGTASEVKAVVTDIRFVDKSGGYRWQTVDGQFTVEVFGNTAVVTPMLSAACRQIKPTTPNPNSFPNRSGAWLAMSIPGVQ